MDGQRRRKVTAVIGLTGGIASGKSTVAARLRERGARVIDADQVARAIVEPGQPALAAIETAFGGEYLLADGTLNRGKLGGLVFSDPAALGKLNAITHPAILARVGGELLDAQRAGWPWVVYEAALILENGLSPGLSELVIVIADPETQVRRLMARNDLDERSARARLSAQTDNAKRRDAADRLIENDGGIEDLQAASDALFEVLTKKYGAVPPVG